MPDARKRNQAQGAGARCAAGAGVRVPEVRTYNRPPADGCDWTQGRVGASCMLEPPPAPPPPPPQPEAVKQQRDSRL
ncbi:homeobox protein Hox-A10-like [Anabas testudineus]|uniref:homeobox protein Hox-A10-like n=1 Tax=Anabas testudineus TaxID=64144 RepID=UPI000E4579F1|nr:homeobox protein Hox-A10-like [Anabas testudineus]